MIVVFSFVYMKHEAWANFSKFSYKYRDKSAAGDIGGYMKIFKFGTYGVAVGGDFVVWMGYDVGPIQLDPIYADYYVYVGGFKELEDASVYVFIEHPCLHYIDHLDTISLYWNALRVLYRTRDFEVSVAQYIHSDKYKFLSMGTDWSTDLKAFKRVKYKLWKDMSLFVDVKTFLALSRNYKRIYSSLDFNMGLEFFSKNGDFSISLGYKPYENTGIIRDSEGVPYLKLGVRGF